MNQGLVILIQLGALLAMGIICSAIANNRGRNALGWFFIGIIGGCLGLIMVLVLPDLMGQRRLLTKADQLARRIDRLAATQAGTAIHLCGYSSGCYLVTEAVKRLQRPEAVGTVVLLAGSM